MKRLALAHVICPVKAEAGSELAEAQPITFASMLRAREFAAAEVEVRLLTAQYPEDRGLAPVEYSPTADLTRSVLDLRSFGVPRRLPLLADILDRLERGAGDDCEALIYSNVDIALLPHFYLTVAQRLTAGYDAFVVNRRTLAPRSARVADLPLLYADPGEKHPGYDCFVFSRELSSRFSLGNLCLGAAWVGRGLLANLVTHARRFAEFGDDHLTFHVGDAQTWRAAALQDYQAHNRREYERLIAELEERHGPFAPELRSYLLDTGAQRILPRFLTGLKTPPSGGPAAPGQAAARA